MRPLRTLEDQRKALAESIETAERGVWIVSPFISSHAIEADGMTEIIRRAVERGVEVTVYFDPDLNREPSGIQTRRSVEGRRMLTDSGATVKATHSIHNKTLCVDRRRLIEGSFNWFSAQRDETSPYRRKERSLLNEGSEVAGIIEEAIQDMESSVL